MNCHAAEKWILNLLDGELSLAEREILDAHLHSCAQCHKTWEEHRRLAQMVSCWAARDSIHQVATDAFTSNLMGKIANQPQSLNSPLWMPLLLVALTLTALWVYFTDSLEEIKIVTNLACVVPDWITGNLISLLAQMPGTWQTATLEAHLSSWSVCLLLGMCFVNTLFYSRAVQSRKGSLI